MPDPGRRPDAGPPFAGSTALSIGTGGGNCSTGGTTYGRPVVPLLAAPGRSIR